MSSPPMVALITVLVVLLAYTSSCRRDGRRSRAAVPPAIVAGLAIFLLGQLFLFAAPRVVGVAALAGPLATAFIALAWLSFSYQALLYGAAWVRVRDDAMTGGQASPETRRRAALADQPWRVPQRRQNRALADSDRPQLTHGWTPVGFGDVGRHRGPR